MIADRCPAWVRHALRQASINLVGVIVENVVRTEYHSHIGTCGVAKLHVEERFRSNFFLGAALVYSFAIEVCTDHCSDRAELLIQRYTCAVLGQVIFNVENSTVRNRVDAVNLLLAKHLGFIVVVRKADVCIGTASQDRD